MCTADIETGGTVKIVAAQTHASPFDRQQLICPLRGGAGYRRAMARPITQQRAIDENVNVEPSGGTENGGNSDVIRWAGGGGHGFRYGTTGWADTGLAAIRKRCRRVRAQQRAHRFGLWPRLRIFNRHRRCKYVVADA
ncbi:hypothetical protein AKG08_26425 [Achromobacter piechaudii]|nr:hypothetical protein AKG08_26425 [Achromobacter piechaudii]